MVNFRLKVSKKSIVYYLLLYLIKMKSIKERIMNFIFLIEYEVRFFLYKVIKIILLEKKKKKMLVIL